MKPEAEYTPWPKSPVTAWLDPPADDLAELGLPNLRRLWFLDPDGRRAMVHVEQGITLNGRLESKIRQHVWSIDDLGEPGELVTVSPSIHFVGHFHTPRPVRFLLATKAEVLQAEDD